MNNNVENNACFCIENANVLINHSLQNTAVTVSAGRITEIGAVPQTARCIDATGLTLLPAMIDLHGDAFERQIMPRPGVYFPIKNALIETDKQLAANGIATAYHAVTLSWEPGLRSVAQAQSFVDSLSAQQASLSVDNRLQLRWETFAFEAMELVQKQLKSSSKPTLAFNDHTSMAMLHPDTPLQERPFELDPQFPTIDLDTELPQNKLDSRSRRSGLSPEAYRDLLASVWQRRGDVPKAIDDLATAAKKFGVAMLSHDDSQIKTRDYFRARGAGISEFPMQQHVAEAATASGDSVIFGAPNVVRGGSHIGSPSAEEMIKKGYCQIIASDYFYPSLLAAIAKLISSGVGSIETLWHLVSTGPAQAVHLTDRGTIEVGSRADLVLIDWREAETPRVKATWSNGQIAYWCD